MECAPVARYVGVQVVVVLSAGGTEVVVTGSTLNTTPPVVMSETDPAEPLALCELRDCRVALAVIVPLELTTRAQVGAIVPLKMTLPVAAKAGEVVRRAIAQA